MFTIRASLRNNGECIFLKKEYWYYERIRVNIVGESEKNKSIGGDNGQRANQSKFFGHTQ